MVSCLTVTREGRLAELARAVRCFAYQTLEERELVILHDGDDGLDREIRLLARVYDADIQVRRAPRGLPLGALRNLSLQLASHDIVCQWDDDDLYHPRRLELQLKRLRAERADFCFLTDQLHYFEASGEMYWDDWTVEEYPMRLIQGSLLGRRDLVGPYPHLARGEDTPVVVDIADRGCRTAELGDHGYLYIYVFNGRNAWGLEHHRAISAWKALQRERLLEHRALLEEALGDYGLPETRVVLPYDGGALELALGR